MDARGTEFSRGRLVEIVSRLRQRRPEEIMQAALGEVDQHSRGGVYEDDRILMVMKAN